MSQQTCSVSLHFGGLWGTEAWTRKGGAPGDQSQVHSWSHVLGLVAGQPALEPPPPGGVEGCHRRC